MNQYQTNLGTASLTIHCATAEEAAQLALDNFGCKLEPKQFKLVAPSNKSHINISLQKPESPIQPNIHQEVVKAVAQGVTMPASIAKPQPSKADYKGPPPHVIKPTVLPAPPPTTPQG